MKQVPWPFHILVWYYKQPILGYGVLFVIALCWGLLPHTGEVVVLTVLLTPWLACLLILLNYPFMSGVIKSLRLTLQKRRNHALEHGTIHCFFHKHGQKKKVSGRAKADGFRIAGIHSTKEIREAFAEFLSLNKQEQWKMAISTRCGSMLVIAQGIGIISLLSALIFFGVWQPSPPTIALTLGAQLLLFLGLRYPLGRLLQKHRLLSLDFEDAKILDIKQVDRIPLIENGPVYFVRTHVQSDPTSP
ncbi:MAG: hypothetical protein KC643_11215 [Nitrospira sp.]|nr:hypothetical protein [Nitrospira sp.]